MKMSYYFGHWVPRPLLSVVNIGVLYCPYKCKGHADYRDSIKLGHSALWDYVQHMKDIHGYTRGL